MAPHEKPDPVLDALDHLERALDEAGAQTKMVLDRADLIRRLRAEGQSYRDIVPAEPSPLIVEYLTHRLQVISDASSRLRKAEARALYDEGLTMAEIGDLFGVSRQRVAALLRRDAQDRNGSEIATQARSKREHLGGETIQRLTAWAAFVAGAGLEFL